MRLILSAVSNCSGVEKWLMSPVCNISAGRRGSALALSTAAVSVPGTLIRARLEANMAVAHLQEGEICLRCLCRRAADETHGSGHTGGDRPKHAGADPADTFHELAARGDNLIMIIRHGRWSLSVVTHTVLAAGQFYSCHAQKYFCRRRPNNPGF